MNAGPGASAGVTVIMMIVTSVTVTGIQSRRLIMMTTSMPFK